MDLAEYYTRFADVEAHGVSDRYEEWARGVATDEEVKALLDALPPQKRQANLVFAAARWCGAPLADYRDFRDYLLRSWDAVAAVIRARSTQTNEPARCATLLPALARIDGPIALLEVGASAGLCLYPDRYSYRYHGPSGTTRLDADGVPAPVVLDCAIDRDDDVPTRLPDVVWRAGIDLHPVDVADPGQLAWLDTLIWPGQEARRANLHAAASVVTADRPTIVAGDLTRELNRQAAAAPPDATLVVFHSAVLAYLPSEKRQHFARQVSALDAVWLSNEGPSVLPQIAARMSRATQATRGHADAVAPAQIADGAFVLAVDGRPVARTGPHGQFYRRLEAPG
ncbi:DUF2332 domain-containing protein [Spelaeicoccus albus]|uniref:DUF2332 domain-containing protein n=1 Tax=Spelaeicoccus albus TaxID=1280376 RepID=A0A7Z0ABA5_9MICO|nr:DUF2332 domain-containing protein [Spelaeicoccus albus]NYI66493.1 hypothetical protein [Spelaeicoccus albus]